MKRLIVLAAVAFAIPNASHACDNKEYAQIKDELAAQGREAMLKQYCRTFTEGMRAAKAHGEMALTVQKLAAYGGADRATVERVKAVQADAEVCSQQSLKMMTALGLTLETAQYKVCAEDGSVLSKENSK